jgi:hypothetical protein
MAVLPAQTNERVELVAVPAKSMIVFRCSVTADDPSIATNAANFANMPLITIYPLLESRSSPSTTRPGRCRSSGATRLCRRLQRRSVTRRL